MKALIVILAFSGFFLTAVSRERPNAYDCPASSHTTLVIRCDLVIEQQKLTHLGIDVVQGLRVVAHSVPRLPEEKRVRTLIRQSEGSYG